MVEFVSYNGSFPNLCSGTLVLRIDGVERTFPVHSPKIDKIEVVRRGDVRRAKLYYLRKKVGKAAKIKEKSFR